MNRQESKVKINKIIPYGKVPKSKTEPLVINGENYAMAPTRLEENYTGFTIYLHLIVILPDSHDYVYLKVDVKAENQQFGKLINRKQDVFKDIKKNNSRRDIVFEFTPESRGRYCINMDTSFRVKYFVQGSQPPQEKRENSHITLKCEDPFDIKEHIITEDRTGSITFPLLVQYTLESKIHFPILEVQTHMESEKFKAKPLHGQNTFALQKNQVFYLMYQIEPKSVKEILSQKGITIGHLRLRYGVNGQHTVRTSLKTTDKYVFFRGETLTKNVPKKDIAQIQIKFSKVYNLNFNLGSLKIVIDEQVTPAIKIIKTSKDKINLDQNADQTVTFSIICLKSGYFQLKGVTLYTNDDLSVYFINDLNLYVSNELEHKVSNMLQQTAEYVISDSLL